MNIDQIKSQFPIFKQKTPLGKDLVYLDNAATCHKPQSVIDAISTYYSESYGTVGRSVYWPAGQNTARFEIVREKAKTLINAKSSEEIIFTFGTTDGINKLASAFLRPRLKEGDEILISEMEHHANILPWQSLAEEVGANLKVIPMLESGELDYHALPEMLNEKVKLLAITAMSNALGVENDLKRISSLAHQRDIPVLVDAAQAIPHTKIDVQELDVDFLVFSGHKIYGPTGVGVLYGKKALLEELPPLSLGGGIVQTVTFDKSKFQGLPKKHEAGTPNISGVLGMGAAIDFLNSIGIDQIHDHCNDLVKNALAKLSGLKGVKIIGTPQHRAPVISFTVNGIHPHDLATFLAEQGICIRAGHHCAQPVLSKFKVNATSRVSFAVYNQSGDIDVLLRGIVEAQRFFNV